MHVDLLEEENLQGNLWIVYDDAFTFKEKHSEEFLNSPTSRNQEMKGNLTEFLNTLKKDDNPVLIIIYLKK